jgi:hypothetical protein
MLANKAAIIKLLEITPTLVNHAVEINESISRRRNISGHDRHFATQSQFALTVKSVDTLISGTQLQFGDGAHTWYGIALDCVVHIDDHDPQRLEIVEHFETEMERRTIIRLTSEAR